MTSHTEFGWGTTAAEVADAFPETIKGANIVITGVGMEGIGGALAEALAAHEPGYLFLAGRTVPKLGAVIAIINEKFPSIKCKAILADLSSNASVRKAAAEINSLVDTINLVINNAGVMAIPNLTLSEDGIELQLAANHVGHFLLTNLLMEKIKKAASSRPGATRIINVSSSGHTFSPVRFEDYNFDGKPIAPEEVGVREALESLALPTVPAKEYLPFVAYGQSKTANILFSTYLAEKLAGQGIGVFSLHPGVVATALGRHLPMDSPIFEAAKTTTFKTREQGGSTTLVAALDLALFDRTGAYLSDCQIETPAPYANDPKLAEKFWTLSEKFVGQKFAL
ncbi:hypothetical protein AJ80_09290 [Polytolypa hystricis UAMH7299]|uniref:Short-chain dehydrogenase n=1 Tax=Polytolypa hystricis (strain UAMH7299) TaxID=1447883 RepID=A0A2B7WTM8_POLH7|nr:hypothetical protein AJ80_09290 [Polytolypa hystricis UAMH7299]